MHSTLRRQNAIILPQVPTKYSAPGVPDVLCVHRYYRGFIEAKVEPYKPSHLQLDMAKILHLRGMPVVFLYFGAGGTYNNMETPLRVHDWQDRYLLSSVPTTLLTDLRFLSDPEI